MNRNFERNASGRLARRTVLRGLGTALALPWFESLLPRARAEAMAGRPPVRLGFVYVPNGVNMSRWRPTAPGPLADTAVGQCGRDHGGGLGVHLDGAALRVKVQRLIR